MEYTPNLVKSKNEEIATVPIKAKITVGFPKLSTTSLLNFFLTKTNLNMLLEKCTIPVNAIVTPTGNKIIITAV